jgi:tetratricopeptide (TPR) repeat protein
MPSSPALDFYHRALKEFGENRFSEAILLLREALRLDPSFKDAYEALGLVYHRTGALDDAISVMRELARVDPDHLMAHTNLSRFYAAKGWLEEAEKEQAEARRLTWKAELKSKNTTGPAPANEARLLEEKIEKFRKVIALDPRDVLGYFSLATVYLEAKRYGLAREFFEQAVSVDAAHSPSYLGWGQALEALGRTAEATIVYRKGVAAAEARGDMIPLKKMQTRLERLENPPPP